ncbi:uncharacterized protein LOC122090531 [Macadamia integrifolia]|uniref:uncharacterized protein LOC122090531 n=1 Tax=Macadamia integrifolia TaxID=60698 RepID=UPI001C4EE637|nr:uncharacterized protein LOC122090531 [Macadamia integrifolia]
MDAAYLMTWPSSRATFSCFNGQWSHLNTINLRSFHTSCYNRRSRDPKKRTKPTSDQKLEMVIDLEEMADRASTSLQRVLTSSELKFRRFVSSGREAFRDLQSLIIVDADRRVVISCRRSSLQFLATFVLWSWVVVFAFRVLVKVVGLGFRSGFGFGYGMPLFRRDRSLGGREVFVGRRRPFMEREGKKKDIRVASVNPLSPARGNVTRVAKLGKQKPVSAQEKMKLPSWWPVELPSPALRMNKQEFQREADRLIRAILDNRMSGEDIVEDDVIQLRRICKTSGARVCIETANTRDSFYRASVEFVLNACSSSMSNSLGQIDEEDPRQFVAGLANNIGLDSSRAATIVSAAVAARTRSQLLQSWALEMQGKHSDAMEELSKIYRVHRAFPPEESSPEMEMVARGLEKHLRTDQREFLLTQFMELCGVENQRSVAEALGLERKHL